MANRGVGKGSEISCSISGVVNAAYSTSCGYMGFGVAMGMGIVMALSSRVIDSGSYTFCDSRGLAGMTGRVEKAGRV